MNLAFLPTAITIARLLAVVPLVWLLADRQYEAALWLALIAGFSDGLDGFLAKRYGWESRLGGGLDPLADKVLLSVRSSAWPYCRCCRPGWRHW